MVKVLLEIDSMKGKESNDVETPPLFTLKIGQLYVLKVLIQYNTSVCSGNNRGATPLLMASLRNGIITLICNETAISHHRIGTKNAAIGEDPLFTALLFQKYSCTIEPTKT